jgi:heparinase II/III-like protein
MGQIIHAFTMCIAASLFVTAGGPGLTLTPPAVPNVVQPVVQSVVDPVDPVDPADLEDADDLEAAQAEVAAVVSGDTGCGAAARNPVPDGVPIVVVLAPAPPFTVGRIPASTWRVPPVKDAVWRLNFYSFKWIKPLALRAFQDGQHQSLRVLVNQAIAFNTQNPDRGRSDRGWDEGSSLRRLESLNCLYALSGDSRLVAGMRDNVAVQFSSRYYGPPRHQVHNHGLMANLAIVRAGQLLGVKSWQSKARARIRAEAPLAFTRLGTTWEQSASYHVVNLTLWTNAAKVLAQANPKDPAIRVIDKVTAKAKTVRAWLTEPDGNLVQIGDTITEAGVRLRSTARVFRDDQAGLIIGRWSWTDPTTTYYSLRYGPPRRAHGQQDKASVTWTTAGTRVLVGPGDWAPKTAFHLWDLTMAAHNTAVPAGVTRQPNPRASTSVRSGVVQGPAHAWAVSDNLYGRAHTRSINVNHPLRRFRVTDTFAGRGSTRQYWHLDPAWVLGSAPIGGTRLVFRHPSGKTLTITTSGRLAALVRGSTRPVAGWHFPKVSTRVPSWQIAIGSVGRTTSTTFTVT